MTLASLWALRVSLWRVDFFAFLHSRAAPPFAVGVPANSKRRSEMPELKHLRKQAVEHHAPPLLQLTILEWKHLLRDENMKDVVIESLRFLVKGKRAVVYG